MARGRLSCGGKASGVFPEMIHQRSYLSTSAITSPAGSDHCGTTRSRSELAGNWSSPSADRTGSPCLCREGRRIKGGKKTIEKSPREKGTKTRTDDTTWQGHRQGRVEIMNDSAMRRIKPRPNGLSRRPNTARSGARNDNKISTKDFYKGRSESSSQMIILINNLINKLLHSSFPTRLTEDEKRGGTIVMPHVLVQNSRGWFHGRIETKLEKIDITAYLLIFFTRILDQ